MKNKEGMEFNMKNSSILSAIIGGTFFAVPYLGLSVGILPSLAIGAVAFGAGELVFYSKEKKDEISINKDFKDVLLEAKTNNKKILSMIPKIEDNELKNWIKEINETISKIIDTIERKPEKYTDIEKFFDYYVPVTLNILDKYDEIENQGLNSEDSKKFMIQTKKMIEKINIAFKNQLSNLYQSDIINLDAEMKVFDNMLKSDGYDTNSDFNIQNKE